MSTPVDCFPWFHAEYAPLANATQVYVSSGCSVNAQGNIPCDPEMMRASAEQTLRAAGYNVDLSLEAYTLARYMQGEVGDGSIEERVAVGEAAVNRAKLEGKSSANDILLYRQPVGHPNRGFYGPIHGPGGVTTAPYGRWATTQSDPTVLTLLLANLIASGQTNDFSRGADDQDGIEYSAAFPNIPAYLNQLAANHKFWVGPLPGVDPWRTFLQTTIPSESNQTPGGQQMIQDALAQIFNADGSRNRPTWDPNMPVCARPATRNQLWGIAAIGFLAGLFAAAHRLLSPSTHR